MMMLLTLLMTKQLSSPAIVAAIPELLLWLLLLWQLWMQTMKMMKQEQDA